MPPQPEFLEVKQICQGRESKTYRITTGKKSHPVLFYMRVFFPKAKGIFPAVVDGDINGDGLTGAAEDFSAMRDIITGSDSEYSDINKQAADLNGDGIVNSTDLTIMKSLLN